MSLKMKLKRIGAMTLAIMMMLSGMSFSSAEGEIETPEVPDESTEMVEAQETLQNDIPEETEQNVDAKIPEEQEKESENEITVVDSDDAAPSTEEPAEEPVLQNMTEPETESESESEPTAVHNVELQEENPAPIETKEESSEPPVSKLRRVIDEQGYAYAYSTDSVSVCSDKAMKDVLFTSGNTRNLWLVTAYTDQNVVSVYGLDDNDSVIHGYIQESALEDIPLTGEEVSRKAENSLCESVDTGIGEMLLFVISGNWAEQDEPVAEEPESEPAFQSEETALIEEIIQEDEPVLILEEESSEMIDDPLDTIPEEKVSENPETGSDPTESSEDNPATLIEEDPLPDDSESVPADESEAETEDESETSTDEPNTETVPEETEESVPNESEDELPEESTDAPENNEATDYQEESTEEPNSEDAEEPAEDEPIEEEIIEEPPLPEVRELQEGDFVFVTTATRVFSGIDSTAFGEGFPSLLEGSFVKNAVVQIDHIETDDDGHIWYRVAYLYGDVLANGKQKWSAIASVYVLAEETSETEETSLTLTDFAYTKEQQQLKSKSGRKLMAATPMSGFSLKNISVSLGSFSVGQTGLRGSSGKDSDYPQLAKSSSHGTIYATPHYLSGYMVYCLEHTLDGPGEGTGSNLTPTGPYNLLDLNGYCNTSAGIGVSGFQFKESTMHAIAWVLRHTYPYMVLNRSDSNNNAWSRVAGQFAIREVIKQLEGSQYVRSYWNMSEFYSFSGGAPSVYLTYAKWLATNGIARASITGTIDIGNKNVSVSGGNYIGSVTVNTDADLIRIPRSAGTLTGNSGGMDSYYYYVKSGDTIQITSAQNKFSVTMESTSSADEEAGFLVGVPSASIQKVLIPTSSGPYPLKSRTVSFELTYGDISVTKKASDGTLLKGAVIELLNESNVIATATTDASGKAIFSSVTPGTYTIREKTAPQGFTLGNANTQSVTVAAGVTTTATFTNQPITKKIRINKTDSATGKGLPGATFTVTRLSGPDSFTQTDIGQVVATITTNASGIAETGALPYGEYRITETGVPDGYLDSGFTTTQWIQ